MNDDQAGNPLSRYINNLLNVILLSKPFNFTVKLSPENCVERLKHFERPKIGFWGSFIEAAKITQVGSSYQFEICAMRKGGSFPYNSAKVSGSITAANNNLEVSVIKGNIRLGITYLVFPALFVGLAIISLRDLSTPVGFVVLAIAIFLLNIPFGRRDARQLATIIRNAFSDVGEITDGWP